MRRPTGRSGSLSSRGAPLLALASALASASCVGTASSALDAGGGGVGGSSAATGGATGGAIGGVNGGNGVGGAVAADGGMADLPVGAGAGGRAGRDGGGVGMGGSAGAAASGGSSGAAGAGGVSLCTPGRYIVCEGFEAAAVGTNVAPAGWTRAGAVDIVADAANVYRGAHAMRINAAASGPRRITLSGAAVAALGGSHWGRVFYKVQTPAPRPAANNVVHSTFVAGAATSPVSGTIEVRVVDTVEDATGHHQFLYNVQPNVRGEFGKGSPYNWTYDGNWHCAEWHVDYATQSYHFYFDGAEVTQIAINNGAGNFTNSELPLVFSSLSVGWNNYQTSTPGFVGWFDEIAMDLARIGCGG